MSAARALSRAIIDSDCADEWLDRCDTTARASYAAVAANDDAYTAAAEDAAVDEDADADADADAYVNAAADAAAAVDADADADAECENGGAICVTWADGACDTLGGAVPRNDMTVSSRRVAANSLHTRSRYALAAAASAARCSTDRKAQCANSRAGLMWLQ
jgi:hypothetical protein